VAIARAYWSEVVYRNIEILKACVRLNKFEKQIQKNPETLQEARTKLISTSKKAYKNFNATVDQDVFEKLMQLYKDESPSAYLSPTVKNANVNELSKEIYEQSKLISLAGFEALLTGTKDEVVKKLNADKGYVFGKELAENYYQKVNPKYNDINLEIKSIQKVYMKALIETFPEERFFPDANSTLRVTYGKVSGYNPRDAVYYKPVSYLEGVMEKYKPGDYEFDVPEKLQKLYEDKDYGIYGEDGKMPVNFIGTNHTTGGNSGSPAIDAHGNLIGLNFDRVWEGTMSDYNYDPDICRNIMVDARYILFIIDKFAGSQRLIDEMKLVHPKKK